MSWAAYGPQKPSSDGLRSHHASENDIGVICVPAGHNTSGPASEKRPQQDSNLRSRLRRALLGRLVTWESGPAARVQGCTWGAGMRSDT